MKPKRDIAHTIDEALASYDSTVRLLGDYLKKKANPQEVILLACARLDSLANLAYPHGGQREKFVRFLSCHSRFRDSLSRISVSDLYFHLRFHLWILPGTIDKPGRLHLFNPDDDRELITLVWQSELPVTQEDIGHFLRFLLRQLSSRFRVLEKQSSKRTSASDSGQLLELLRRRSHSCRGGAYAKAIAHVKPLIEKFTLASLLYTKYRCGIIHRHCIPIQESGFFSRALPYWSPFYNGNIQSGGFLEVQFPGKFLFNAFVGALSNYKKSLKDRKRLPAELFFDNCDPLRETEYLDEQSLPEGKDGQMSF